MNWAFGLLLFVLGTGLGYLLRSRMQKTEGDVQTLRRELEQARFDLSQRQQEMTDHFQQSRELMAQLNESWAKANSFLNESAHNLLGESQPAVQQLENKEADTSEQTEVESEKADETNPKNTAPKDYAKGSSGMLTDKERVTAD